MNSFIFSHPPRTRPGARLLLSSSAVLGLLLSNGCRTVDPSGDLERANALAEASVGGAPFESSDAAPWRGDRALGKAEAIDLALRHAPAIIALRPTIAHARTAVVEASQPPNPVFRWMVGVPVDSMEAVPFFLGVAQDLGYLLQRDALIEIAELELEAEVLAAANAFVEKVFEIETQHRVAIAAEERRRLASDRIGVAASALTLARDREAVGEGSPSETALADAALQHAHARAADAARRSSQAKLALLLAMGRPGLPLDWCAVDDTLDAAHRDRELLDLSAADSPSVPDESMFVRAAFANRLDLLAADLEACARFESIEIAAKSIWNALSFGVGFDRDMEGLRGVPFSGSVPIPIFDDGSVPRARAEAAWQRAMIQRLALAQRIETEVRSAWIDRIAAIEAFEAREAEARQIDRSIEAIREAYQGGFEPLDEVFALEAKRLDVLADVIDARTALDLSRIALRRAVGGRVHAPQASEDRAIATDRNSPAPEDRS